MFLVVYCYVHFFVTFVITALWIIIFYVIKFKTELNMLQLMQQ